MTRQLYLEDQENGKRGVGFPKNNHIETEMTF